MESNLGEIIKSSLANIKELAGTETVIGDPIVTSNGTTIIPVSKVSVGFASGGLDSLNASKVSSATTPAQKSDNQKKESSNDKIKGFTGGGGSGISVTPMAFLVVHADGTVDLLNIAPNGDSRPSAVESISALIERSPSILKKLKSVFSKKSADEEEEEADSDLVPNEEKPL